MLAALPSADTTVTANPVGRPPPRQLDRQFPRSGCARGLSADDSADDIAPKLPTPLIYCARNSFKTYSSLATGTSLLCAMAFSIHWTTSGFTTTPTSTGPRLCGRGTWSAQNRELVRYFYDRRIWLLEADTSPPALSPYVDDETVITQ